MKDAKQEKHEAHLVEKLSLPVVSGRGRILQSEGEQMCWIKECGHQKMLSQ